MAGDALSYLIIAFTTWFLLATGVLFLEGLWPDLAPPAWVRLLADIALLLMLAWCVAGLIIVGLLMWGW